MAQPGTGPNTREAAPPRGLPQHDSDRQTAQRAEPHKRRQQTKKNPDLVGLPSRRALSRTMAAPQPVETRRGAHRKDGQPRRNKGRARTGRGRRGNTTQTHPNTAARQHKKKNPQTHPAGCQPPKPQTRRAKPPSIKAGDGAQPTPLPAINNFRGTAGRPN